MAQSVEQLIRNQQVSGSSPLTSSIKKVQERCGFLDFFAFMEALFSVVKGAKEHRQKLFSAGFTNPSAASKSRWTRQGCGQRRASIFQLGQGVFLNSIHFVRSQGMEEQLENLRNAVKALKKRIERPSPSAITGSLPWRRWGSFLVSPK